MTNRFRDTYQIPGIPGAGIPGIPGIPGDLIRSDRSTAPRIHLRCTLYPVMEEEPSEAGAVHESIARPGR